MRAAKGLRIKGWESSWLGLTMDTWTGPRELMAKKKKKFLFPVVSGHLPSIATPFDRISRSTNHAMDHALSIIVYVRNAHRSNLYPLSGNIIFLNLFLLSHRESSVRFLQQYSEREREKKKEFSESTSNRLPIQSYDNYFAQPLRTRYTNENHSRTCFPFFLFFLSFLHLNQYYSRSSRVSAKTITCIISRTNKEEPVSRVPRNGRGRERGRGRG